MKITILTILCLWTASAFAQNFADKDYYLIDSLNLDQLTETDIHLVDSCLKVYHAAKHDTDKVNALNGICEGMMDESWHKYQYIQYRLIQKALDQLPGPPTTPAARALSIALAGALNNIGYVHLMKGEIQKALEYYHRTKEILEQTGYKAGLATYYNSVGFIHDNQGDIPLALEYFHKSLKIEEEIANKEGMANSYNNIGHIHDNQGDIPLALEYYHKSLKIFEEIGNKKGMASSYNNIGFIHRNQGDIRLALEYYHKSLKIFEEIGNKKGMAVSYNNIGLIHKRQGDIPLALEYYHKSLKIKEELSDKKGIANSLASIGTLHLGAGAEAQARESAARGLKIAFELGFPEQIEGNAALLSKVARKQGNFKEALEMYELQVQYRDSIKNEETQKATIRQQTKYEFEKAQLVKEQQEKEQVRVLAVETSRRDNLQYSIVLICLLAIGGLVAMLGRLSLPERVAEGLIFFAFLIFFEFVLVLADPYVENWTGGAPGLKLLINAGVAALIFPLHAFFEGKMKKRLVKSRT